MPNKSLFDTARAAVPAANTRNEAGGRAYKMSDKQALAQYAVTGCFNNTYYVKDEDHLATVNGLLASVDPEFIAKVAVYARTKGYMKDMPAFMVAYLAVEHPKREDLLRAVFPAVIDNGKMLRNLVTFIRSDPFGWKGSETDPARKKKRTFPNPTRRLLKAWFAQDPNRIFYANVGDPSLRDILRMVHPRPATESHNALFAKLLGKEYNAEALPALVKEYEAFKAGPVGREVPKVPFQMITGMPGLTRDIWVGIAQKAKWMMTRMNLNTFARHGVFDDPVMVDLIAARLKDADQVRRARQFPYQMLAAYLNVSSDVPFAVKDALHDAMEIACENTPVIPGNVVICPDVSGSMKGAAITGNRGSATSTIRCVDVAALIASAILRTNKAADVIPFEGAVREVKLEPRDTVMTNAKKLAAIGGGSTNCSAPLALLNRRKAKVDVVIYVSDYESWVDDYSWSRSHDHYGFRSLAPSAYNPNTLRHGRKQSSMAEQYAPTSMQGEWQKLKSRCPGAKLVCIDLTPNKTAQVVPDKSILQVGGFSDQVFSVVADFVRAGGEDAWVKMIDSMDLEVART